MRAAATMLCALCVTAAAPSRGFAQTPPDAALRGENERLRDALSPFLGTLDIDCSPAGASVYVNDHLQGTCPLGAPLRVPEQRAVVRIERQGMTGVREEVAVYAGQTSRLYVHLGADEDGAPFVHSTDRERASTHRGLVIGGLGTLALSLGVLGLAYAAYDKWPEEIWLWSSLLSFGGVFGLPGVVLLTVGLWPAPEIHGARAAGLNATVRF